jgi:hypothetical protein
VNANAGAINEQAQLGALTTGHTVQFMNTTHYFMNFTGAGRTAAIGGTAQPGMGGAAAATRGTVGTRPQTGTGVRH